MTNELKRDIETVREHLQACPELTAIDVLPLDRIAAALEAGERDSVILRRLLWLRHGHHGIYGDDGEMQCATCTLDFKREPADIIERSFEIQALIAAREGK